ncbi:MAG: two-component sensor histidine kinase [Hyphomicrobiaceae bacterium]|nr:two-component sensor histidine kinase [Hyphomicrobiaceae bacterium]
MIKWLWPASIRGQLAVLMVSGVVFIHAAVFALLVLDRHETEYRVHPAEVTGQLAAIVVEVRAEPPATRPALVARLAGLFPQFALALAEWTPPAPSPASPGPGAPPGGIARDVPFIEAGAQPLRRLLGGDAEVIESRAAGDRALRLAIRLDAATALTARVVSASDAPFGLRLLPFPFGGPILITLAFLAVSFVLLGLWAANALSRPLRAIARRAAAWEVDAAPIAPIERGAAEVRAVSKAIADMQARIARLVADRTRLLTAVSHDLRTPITRLRLRAEFVPDAAERRRMLQDLEQMDSLIVGALSYLRDGRTGESRHRIDLASLVATIADDFADAGTEIPVTVAAAVAVEARPRELGRAITNIVDNALKYAGNAEIWVGRAPDGSARIEISDTGAGIAEAERESLFEAFVRGDLSRGMNDQDGFGLGLSIARAIVASHGGRISLHDAEPQGLKVRIDLPA